MALNCAACQCALEDALILTCGHNLCPPCAAQELKRDLYKADSGVSVAHTCKKCGAMTEVDSDSARQLAKNADGGGRSTPRNNYDMVEFLRDSNTLTL